MTGARVFIAGGTGVIGRRVIPALVRAGYNVTATARSSASADRLRGMGAEPVLVSLFDATALRRAAGKPDIVINLATHMPSSTTQMMLPWSWRENDRVRREGSANLAAAARATGADCYIQESFAPIYADGGVQWIDETWPVAPVRYNRTILDAERAANTFTREGGRGMIAMARKGLAPMPGKPEAYISSVSHDDAASAVVAAITATSGTYNVVEDEPTTRAEWTAALARAVGVEQIKPIPKPLEVLGGPIVGLLGRSLRISNRKFRDVTGW